MKWPMGAAGMLMALTMLGCGVSQDVYQAEYVHARDVEAQNEDLDEQLSEQSAAREALEGELEAEKKQSATLREELTTAQEGREEISTRLDGCQATVEGLRGDLDLSKKATRTGEEQHQQLRTNVEEEKGRCRNQKQQWEAELVALETEREQLRGRISILEADRAVLEEQKEIAQREKRENLAEVSKTYEGLLENMKGEVEQGRVTISQLKGRLSVKLMDEILFPSGSSSVKQQGREVLQRVGEALAGVEDKMIIIQGHTDNVPIRGGLANRFPSNWELSTARAVSVVRYLVESSGIDPTRITAAGSGEFRPVSENDTEEGRSRNRRIEITLIPYESVVPATAKP